MNDRKRPSLMVATIDRDKATAIIKERFKEYNTEHIVAQPMAVVNTKDGLATICIEGVGWIADDNGNYTLLFFNQMSDGYIDITAQQLASIISDEQTDLSTFIRTFGDRLENNFDLWYYRAKSYENTPQKLLTNLVEMV